ncbi:MAG: Xylulose kinase [uncultured bacterium]|nr:MAG: Xylulose kinase [uncultured bacterium]HBY01975.1 hypothetical protein [Rikenellaceae bacterium]
MKTEVLYGIDIGSTSIRCCVYDLHANMLNQASRPTYLINSANEGQSKGSLLWDPVFLWKVVREIIHESTTCLPVDQFHPLGIATSSVGCTFVIIDKAGNNLFPIFRSQQNVPKLLNQYEKKYSGNEFQNITGYPLSSTSAGFILAQLKESYPEEFSKIGTIFPLSNYIAYQMTGEKVSDRSIAASFGLWDHRINSWFTELLRDLSLEPENFGTLISGGQVIGNINKNVSDITGLPVGLPVFSGGHDYLCAAMATGCYQPGQIFNIEGTFEIIATFHQTPVVKTLMDSTRSLLDLHIMPQVYSLMVERVGASQIEWMKNLLLPSGEDHKNDWDNIFSKLDTIYENTTEMEIFIPHVFGKLFPEYEEDRRGAIIGIGGSSTGSSIMKSAIFSHCFESKRMVDYQQQFSPTPINQIITVGGITRSKYWMQTKANILGIKLLVPKAKELSALGAAFLAGKGLEVFTSFQQIGEVALSQGVSKYIPDSAKVELYSEYLQNTYLPVLKRIEEIDNIMSRNSKRE